MKPAPLTLERVAAVLRASGLLRDVLGRVDVPVLGVSQDSRTVRPGELFLAWSGVEKDAHDFVPDAARAGAAAAVVERPVEGLPLPQLVVSDGRLAGALAADAVLGSPWKELFVVAVTGTNGKTTTTLILRHVLLHLGPAAAVGTLGLVEPDGSVRPGTEGLTTPGPVQLMGWLRSLADEAVTTLTLEASSHALAQRRLDALRVNVAVFTNLSRDHLDYHQDLESYFQAKAHLVDLLEQGGAVIVNADDPAWRRLPGGRDRLTFAVEDGGPDATGGGGRGAARAGAQAQGASHGGSPAGVEAGADTGAEAGAEAGADLRAFQLRLGAGGSSFRLAYRGETVPVALPLLGRFNVENALAAAAAALVAGVPLEVVAERLGTAPQVPGRLEVVVPEPYTVLIDYAHTPDALRGVLDTLRPLAAGRLLVLFGAGGDRDRGKRRPMAETVAARADYVVLTSDNPRTEDPEAILDDLEVGLTGVAFERVADRRAAIGRALGRARPGDVLLLAGKGHERHQIVGTERRPFDERAVVRDLLEQGAA